MEDERQKLWDRVEKALDTMRPYLKDDGGNIRIVEITDDLVVRLKLEGSCETCPQSYMTMKTGIESAIIQAVPEIRQVKAVNLIMDKPKI